MQKSETGERQEQKNTKTHKQHELELELKKIFSYTLHVIH